MIAERYGDMHVISFKLKPFSPFRLDLVVWALRRRSVNAIDLWERNMYSRVVVIGKRPVKISVRQDGPMERPVLSVTVKSEKKISGIDLREKVSSLLELMFGLSIDLSGFYTMTERQRNLRPLVGGYIGFRPPRFPTVFEAIVNAFSCQQISLDVGITLLNRLSGRYGTAFGTDDAEMKAFPGAVELQRLSSADLRPLGFSRQKGEAITGLASVVLNNDFDPEALVQKSNEQAIGHLLGIKGVGRWSAEYVLLRGLGRLDIFPGDDVGAQKNLQSFFHLQKRPSYEEIIRFTRLWHPYAGLIYFHFLLDKLRAKGYLP